MDSPPNALPAQTTGTVPPGPLPPYLGPLPQPMQIQLPIELKTIMDQWPAVQADLTALKAKPTGSGSNQWQGIALFLLGGSLMAFAVFAWPYLGKL